VTARVPDFIVAGVRKCGTTWLDRCLREHPQIFMPSATKELFFFDRYWSRGVAWYGEYFADCPPDRLCGEVSPTYFTEPKAPERILSVAPDAKLVFVFRHPVERVISLYHHMRARGDTSLSLSEAIEKIPELIEEGFYARHFARFRTTFAPSSIHAILLDDIEADPHAAFRALFTFVGADPSFSPTTLLAAWTSRRLHAMGLHRAVAFAKRLGAEKVVLRAPKAAPERLDPKIAARLYALYDPEIGELGRMLGRDLRSLWTLERALSGGEADAQE
jgi:hypothetical protein